MKNIISTAIISLISATAFRQTKIPVDSVSKHIGETVTVCSKVYDIKATERMTLINLGAPYPGSPLTIVIFAKDNANFKEPIEPAFNNKNVCVTGVLEDYKGKTEIVISKPEGIVVQ